MTTFRFSATVALLCAIFVGGASTHVHAGVILYINDSNNNLGTVDVGTGTVTVIGNLGSETITDIAFSPTGNLFGISFTHLYQINPATAAVTQIGAHNIPNGNALVFGSDGTLYAAGFTSTLQKLAALASPI